MNDIFCKYGFVSSGKEGAFGTQSYSYPWNKQWMIHIKFLSKLI